MKVEKFKTVLKKRGLKLSWLADQMHLSKPTLTAKLNGLSDLSVEQVKKLYVLLRLSAEEFDDIFFDNLLLNKQITGNSHDERST